MWAVRARGARARTRRDECGGGERDADRGQDDAGAASGHGSAFRSRREGQPAPGQNITQGANQGAGQAVSMSMSSALADRPWVPAQSEDYVRALAAAAADRTPAQLQQQLSQLVERQPPHPRRRVRQPQPGHQRHEPEGRGAAVRRPRLAAVAGLPGRQVRDGPGGDRADRGAGRRARRRGVRRALRRGARRLRRAGQPVRVHGHLPTRRHDHRAAGRTSAATSPTTAPARPAGTG